MDTFKKLFIVLILFFGVLSNANAAQWHVKPSGSGTGSGAANDPWVGFNNIDWTKISAGDTLTGDNQTFNTTLVIDNSNVNVEGFKFDATTSNSISITDKSHITIKSVEVKNSNNVGILVRDSNNISIDSCSFVNNNANDSVRIVENGSNPVRNIEIKSSTFSGGVSQDIISLRFNHHGFRGLHITNNNFNGGRNVIRTLLPSPFSVLEESGSYLSDVQITNNIVTKAIHNVVHLAKIRVAGDPVSHIANNTITRIGSTTTSSRDLNVINIFWCEDVEIHDNVIKGFRAERPDGAAIMPDWAKNNSDDLATNLTRNSTGTKIYNNYIDGNDGSWAGGTANSANQLKGISVWKASDTKVYNNVIVHTNFGLISGGGTQNNKFWNNTVAGGVSFSLNNWPSGAGGTIGVEAINNIFSSNIKAIEKRGNVVDPVENHNLIYNQSGVSDMNLDGSDVITNNNPFVSETDYHINSTSLALNAGIILPEISEDIEHITRLQGSAYDIGAYEYQESGTTIRADVDKNSVINSTDAMLTLRYSLGLDMSSTNWQASATTGDVNCDGSFNSTDAVLILRHSLGLSDGVGWCGG